MQWRALVGVAGFCLVACATGTEPPGLQGSLDSAGQSGAGAAPEVGGAGATAAVGGGGVAGSVSGSGQSGGAVSGSASGGTGGGGAGNGEAGGGGGGTAGAGGAAGSAGTAGAGGKPNEPQPTGVTVSGTHDATAKHAPSDGGMAYDDACPANQVLIGFRATIDGGYQNAGLRSLGGLCASLSVSSTAPYLVMTTAAGSLPERQMAGSVAETATCPAGQVIVGFAGRSATYLEALSFRCAPLQISGSAPNYELATGNASDSSVIGAENAGTPFNAILCGAGKVAVAQMPGAGGAIDNFGLGCAGLTLVVQ